MSAPRDDLIRSVSFRADETEADGDGQMLSGYGAMFDSPTLIDSWEGTFYEQIRRGAFRKSLRERDPVLQFDHGHHPLIGSIPLGAIRELREDEQGLFVQARLSDNWLIQPIRDAIAEGAVDGMSFRFSVVRDEWRDTAGKLVRDAELAELLWHPGERGPLRRTLTEVRLYELGPVVFPAYADTSVGVRARDAAHIITGDRELAREVRASLALETASRAEQALKDLSDTDTRRQVARAILFAPPPDAPPDEGHPSTDEPRDAGLCDVRTGAPPEPGHPPDADADAPPLDGHPSPTPGHDRLRQQIRQITGAMHEVVDAIEGKH